MEAFAPVGVLLFFALVVSGSIYVLTTLLGPRVKSPGKLATYECGVSVESEGRRPFEMRFYYVAVLFLLLDIEAAFFFPWALVFREVILIDPTIFFAMLAYLFFLVLGLFYIYRKKFLGF